jgi:hypothetical protein
VLRQLALCKPFERSAEERGRLVHRRLLLLVPQSLAQDTRLRVREHKPAHRRDKRLEHPRKQSQERQQSMLQRRRSIETYLGSLSSQAGIGMSRICDECQSGPTGRIVAIRGTVYTVTVRLSRKSGKAPLVGAGLPTSPDVSRPRRNSRPKVSRISLSPLWSLPSFSSLLFSIVNCLFAIPSPL